MSITITDEMTVAAKKAFIKTPGALLDESTHPDDFSDAIRRALTAAFAAVAKDDPPVVIVHMTEIGWRPETYHVIGDARLFIVDESAPNDRVYEWLQRADPKVYRELIPEGAEIGSCEDGRHAAIKHRILSRIEGHPALSIVHRDDYE